MVEWIMLDACAVEGFVVQVSPVETILLKVFSVEEYKCWTLPCQSGSIGALEVSLSKG